MARTPIQAPRHEHRRHGAHPHRGRRPRRHRDAGAPRQAQRPGPGDVRGHRRRRGRGRRHARRPRRRALHGDGPSFCSGLDVGSFLADGPNGFDILLDRERRRAARTSPSAWPPTGSTCRCPSSPRSTATASAAACRSRSAPTSASPRPDARLSIMEARWGLVPDMGITQTLTRLVGIDVAKELTFTAAPDQRRGGRRARPRHAHRRRPARRRPRAGRRDRREVTRRRPRRQAPLRADLAGPRGRRARARDRAAAGPDGLAQPDRRRSWPG